ncbi:MAG TPA: hypothetical protein VFO79_00060, partial [Xanthomonadales bacterium]|nr:hypothetical protein [Xanthomonadales bacterium]
ALFMLIMLAIGLAAYALILFAVPRVLFDGMEPIAAMQESLSASLGNIGALLVYGLLMFVAYLVSAVILIIPILGMLVWFVILLAFVAANAAAMYLAYVDVFGGPGQSAVPAPPMPPQGPPGPPPM